MDFLYIITPPPISLTFNKMIKEIESCNNKINQYRNVDENKKKQIRDELKSDKEFMNREFREMFWIIPTSIAMDVTMATDPLIGAYSCWYAYYADKGKNIY